MASISSQNEISQKFTSIRLIGWMMFAFALASCGKVTPLDPLASLTIQEIPVYQVQANFCTPPAADLKQYLKTIIILDHSGSNAQNYKMSGAGDGAPDVSGGFVVSPAYGTDPKGLLRYGTPATAGTLLNYLSTLAPNDATDPTRFFALVDFNSTASTYPTGSSGFTSDIPGFYNHVYDDAGAASGGAPNDTNGTNYLSALTAAYNIMNNDINNAKACAAKATTAAPTAACPKPGVTISSSYVIVFMSDGSPITSIDGVGVDSSGNTVITGPIVLHKQANAEILAQVGTITDLKSNDKYVTSINMHTIYYYVPGNVDMSAQSLLALMAKAGSGLAYNALSGSNLDYSKFQPPKKQVTYTLSDVFVTNVNSVWWPDGKYYADSDGDGLPDDIEKAWGTDSTKYSTANNGVSDLVRYRLANGAACANKNATTGLCQDAVPNYRTGACSGITSSNVGGVLTFKSSDPNGLNDCEKLILGDAAGIASPDSNVDNIPDYLEFLNGIPFQKGTTPAVNQINQDGYTTYEKIKYNLPVTTPLNSVNGAIPANYKLDQVSTADGKTCYSLKVTDFPAKNPGNKVRVDILMKSSLVQDGYLYRVGYKTFNPAMTAGDTLIFNDWNDPTEITNKTWSVWP